jgi:predicted acetyltransferase
MHLRLIPPSPAYFPEIIAFRQEFLDRGERMYGAPSLDKYENLHDWLAHLDAFSSPETCPQGSAPSLQYVTVCQDSGRIVGMANLRLALTPYLREIGGHVGYCIRPSMQKKRYGKEQLRLCLEKYKSLGFDKVLIACDEDNIASKGTILSAGGILDGRAKDEIGAIVLRYWITLK